MVFPVCAALVPQAWEWLTAGWTQAQQKSVLQSLTQLLLDGTQEEQQDATSRWVWYEDAVMRATRGCLPYIACNRA
ncbi:MAG: hypothetical protein HHJ12_15795 [Glaciimonas sp.]|nr:hypothetical protein [Glaciimonas sp.]